MVSMECPEGNMSIQLEDGVIAAVNNFINLEVTSLMMVKLSMK